MVATVQQRIKESQLDDVDALTAAMIRWQRTARASGAKTTVHAMLIALGRFDAVAEAYGTALSSFALDEVARRLTHFAEDEFESGDWRLSYVGEGCFLLAAHEACSRERWQWLAEALADAIAHPISAYFDAEIIRLWPRFGLIRVIGDEEPSHIFTQLQDVLAQSHRAAGRRIFWVDAKQSPRGIPAHKLEADLLHALDNDEIEIVYQPQISVQSGAVIGAEALARWEHKALGRIGGAQLFAIAERADYTAQLSRHILQIAIKQAASWPAHLRVSLNVTPQDLAATRFARDFLALLNDAALDPARVTLEITEQILLGDLTQTHAILSEIKQAGVKIALDDFGAGFCNFRYLKTLPLDYLKLDRAMVEGIEGDERDLGVLRGIVTMAKVLGLDIVAEGVETSGQLQILRDEGCGVFQGFLGGKAMRNAEFLDRITRV